MEFQTFRNYIKNKPWKTKVNEKSCKEEFFFKNCTYAKRILNQMKLVNYTFLEFTGYKLSNFKQNKKIMNYYIDSKNCIEIFWKT